MESFTIELVSNASNQLFPNNSLSSFTNFLPEQVNLKGKWEVAISEISYPTMYQNVTDGKFLFTDTTSKVEYDNLEDRLRPYELPPGLYPSLADIFQKMNELIAIRERSKEFQITFKLDRITQKLEIFLPKKSSQLILYSADLVHIFGCDLRDARMGLWMAGKGPHNPKYEYDILRIHSFMIYTDIIEYNIVGDAKAPLLRCLPFVPKLKSGDVISTNQYMNYQSFQNLQYKRVLKNSFHTVQLELRDTSGEKIPFIAIGITRVVLMFRKVNDDHF